MPNYVTKLFTSCIHRPYTHKNVKAIIYNNEIKDYFKLSRFELLSDEILINIFEYISLKDLYTSFVNLNFRLNIILRDIHIGINLNEYNELNNIYYFNKQIYYLHIDYNPFINLKIFSNINSLIIYIPTKEQLLLINNNIFPNLINLSIGIINKNDQYILYNNIFGINQFIKLKYFYLFYINLNNNNNYFNLYQNCLTIKKLFIKYIKIKDILIILSLLPNLYQLDISIENDILINNYFKKYIHSNLKILKIEFLDKSYQLNLFNYFISFVPFIQQLTLIFINLIKLKDYQILENILSNKLLKLKQFICYIHFYCQLSSNQMINKFNQLNILFPFFQTIKFIPCQIHHDQCLRKIFINQKIIHIS